MISCWHHHYCGGRGNCKPKNGYHRSHKYYLQALVWILIDRSYNVHLVFVTKNKFMMFPYSEGLVPQFWNTLNGISQRCEAKGELNFLDCPDNKKVLFRTWCGWVWQNSDSKGSNQNLMQLSMTRIVSRYMTSFLVLNHERGRYCNGL
jgi:hypothetical protein